MVYGRWFFDIAFLVPGFRVREDFQTLWFGYRMLRARTANAIRGYKG